MMGTYIIVTCASLHAQGKEEGFQFSVAKCVQFVKTQCDFQPQKTCVIIMMPSVPYCQDDYRTMTRRTFKKKLQETHKAILEAFTEHINNLDVLEIPLQLDFAGTEQRSRSSGYLLPHY